MTHSTDRRNAALTLALFSGAAASAAGYDPTGQAGRYETIRAATLVRGAGGTYASVRVWAPWILDEADAFQNSAAAGIDPATGRPVAAVTTFTGAGASAGSARVIAALGTTPSAWGTGSANNVFISEGDTGRSNTIGALLSDGTCVWRANFSAGMQNNVEFQALPAGTLTRSPSMRGAGSVFDPAAPGIDAAPGGVIYLGVPGADRLGTFLYTGVTTFDGASSACPVGMSVYLNEHAGPTTPYASWLQLDCPLVVGASADDARQTQPVIKRVVTSCYSGGEIYACFGVGFVPAPVKAGEKAPMHPYGGGAGRPQYLVVDRVDPGAFANGYATIDADGDGSLTHTSEALRFVSTSAYGAAPGVTTGGLFDMNARGQVVAVREDVRGASPVYEVLLFDPVRDARCRITGYAAPIVIARTGQDGIEGTVRTTYWDSSRPATRSAVPFSGVSIDDEGNVAFTAVTEQFGETRDVSRPPDGVADGVVVLSTTTTLFFWRGASGALYSVLRGGQNGDVLEGDNGIDLRVGAFPVDGASDTFTRAGLSDDGRALALCFRSNVADPLYDLGGGAIAPGQTNQAATRGVIVVSMGAFTSGLAGDADGDGVVGEADLRLVLGAFTKRGAGLAGDVNDDGVVDLRDLNIVLSNYGAGR